MTSYISGVLVFKASNGDTGLLWFPSDCRQKHCQTGLALFQLGQWLLFDHWNDIIVRPLEGMPPYETRLYRTESLQRDVFVEVLFPINIIIFLHHLHLDPCSSRLFFGQGL